MTITQNTRPVPADDSTPDSGWTGPCGCAGCDKWTDCDWCGSCTPYSEEQERWEKERMEYYEALYAREEEEQRPFGEWLFGDDD